MMVKGAWRRALGSTVVAGLVLSVAVVSGAAAGGWLPHQSLDGRGNNQAHPQWGRAGTAYARMAPALYGDGRNTMVDGPDSRYVSNRILTDTVTFHVPPMDIIGGVDIFSETQVSQWGWVWGQFFDHTFGMRQGTLPSQPHGEVANIATDSGDPHGDLTPCT